MTHPSPPIYTKITDYVYDCSTCPTPCDGKSKLKYDFENDVAFSEGYEERITRYYNEFTAYFCQKTTQKGYPDLEIYPTKKKEKLITLIEVKIQSRVFMSVKRLLPKANLFPSETIALNLSDLKRYFEIYRKLQLPMYIVWGVLERPCIVEQGKLNYYYQSIQNLENIYHQYKNDRRFRRKSGKGDIVDGKHKGVVVNYHFSLKELKRGLPLVNPLDLLT